MWRVSRTTWVQTRAGQNNEPWDLSFPERSRPHPGRQHFPETQFMRKVLKAHGCYKSATSSGAKDAAHSRGQSKLPMPTHPFTLQYKPSVVLIKQTMPGGTKGRWAGRAGGGGGGRSRARGAGGGHLLIHPHGTANGVHLHVRSPTTFFFTGKTRAAAETSGSFPPYNRTRTLVLYRRRESADEPAAREAFHTRLGRRARVCFWGRNARYVRARSGRSRG